MHKFYSPRNSDSRRNEGNAMRRFSLIMCLVLIMTAASLPIDPIGMLLSSGDSQLTASAGGRFWGRRRPRTRLTTRSNLCAITPGFIGKLTLWHDRPLFTWKGESAEILLRDYETKQVVWSEKLNSTAQQITYSGNMSLESGKLYEWQVLGPKATDSDRAVWTAFKIMSVKERQTIETDLGALAKKVGQDSREAIALEKADYFAGRNLWSDAVQVLYSIDQASASFVEQRSNYVQDFCPKDTTANQTVLTGKVNN